MGGTSGRPGLFHCGDCRGQFTVRTGQVMERSHIPLAKWVLGYHLMASSKKGVSAHQLHRTLGIAYNSAWFMAHRIREAMAEKDPAPLGGEGKIVEVDEAYHGKAEIPIPSAHRKGRPYLKRDLSKQKRPIVALVERGGEARAKHMRHVTAKNMRDFVCAMLIASHDCTPMKAVSIRRSAKSLRPMRRSRTRKANMHVAT